MPVDRHAHKELAGPQPRTQYLSCLRPESLLCFVAVVQASEALFPSLRLGDRVGLGIGGFTRLRIRCC